MISTSSLNGKENKNVYGISDGFKKANCFRCKKEYLERDLYRIQLKTKKQGHFGGDSYIVCNNCRGENE